MTSAVRAQLQALCEERDRAVSDARRWQEDYDRADAHRLRLEDENRRLHARLAAATDDAKGVERELTALRALAPVEGRRAATLRALLREALAALRAEGAARFIDRRRFRDAAQAAAVARRQEELVQARLMESLREADLELSRLRQDRDRLLRVNHDLARDNDALRQLPGPQSASCPSNGGGKLVTFLRPGRVQR